MKKRNTTPTLVDARNTHFDFNQIVEIPAEADAADSAGLQCVERGSDVHIAFLEQALRDLQDTLDQLKSERAKRSV